MGEKREKDAIDLFERAVRRNVNLNIARTAIVLVGCVCCVLLFAAAMTRLVATCP